MHRSSSPLLRDYKPTAAKSPKKSKALHWFVVGLGTPLLGLAFVSMLNSDADDAPPVPSMPELTAITDDDYPVEQAVAVYTPSPVPLVLAPEPDYSTLTLKIRPGDTLDQLFRQNKLDLGNLATVARLDAAKSRFRKIKPGDVFEIKHDEGRLVSIPVPRPGCRGTRAPFAFDAGTRGEGAQFP
jgi:hypothetical protein